MSSDEVGRSGAGRWLRLLIASFALLVLGGVGAVAAVYFAFLRDLPDLRSVADYRPPVVSVVFDRKGNPIGEFSKERRRLTPMEKLPRHVVMAFVSGEDQAFFQHGGIDFQAILRAAWSNLLAGETVGGASTITQQTVKGLLLSPERTYRRKIREVILARRIEQHFSKEEILFLYLNQIYFGHGAYGVGEAARTYFGKDVTEISVSEAALLAGLPKAPTRYSPFNNPERAEQRRRYVLSRMHEDGVIDQATYEASLRELPQLVTGKWQEDYAAAAYFTEEVRRHLFEVLGGEAVLEGGLQIETTLDTELQKAAVVALRAGLEELDHRQGYRGAQRRVAPKDFDAELQKIAALNGFAAAPPADDADAETDGGDEAAAAPPAPTPTPVVAEGIDPGQRLLLRFEAQGPLVGLVKSVDDGDGVARVAFAPDLEGEVHLKDVSWARPVDPDQGPYEVGRIGEVFKRGDVAHFAPKAPEPDAVAEPAADAGEEAVPPLPRVTLAQTPVVQGALLSFEANSGAVLAFVGGYDFDQSEFNRVTQARRQPGSAFKPLIYGAALTAQDETGRQRYTPASIIYDRPKVYTDQYTGLVWKPKNYGREFYGPITFRTALAKSINTAAVHLCDEVGIGEVIEFARRLGIESPIEPTLATALGTSGLSLLELTRAYAVFDNGGRRVVPRYITKVSDRDGNVLLERVALGTDFEAIAAARAAAPPEPEPEPEAADAEGEAAAPIHGTPAPKEFDGIDGDPRQLITRADAYLMTDMLRAVVLEGTGQKLRVLGRPVAGKTGTTNDQADAWFVGYSPEIVTGVWVGHDVAKFLGSGETGAKAAAPIWRDYMHAALADRPIRDFTPPDSIVFARIDKASGLLATQLTKDTVFQPFLAGSEPTETADDQRSTSEAMRDLREDSLSSDAMSDLSTDPARLMQLDSF